MANLSSAHGTLTVTAPSQEIIEDFLAHIIKPWEDAHSDYTPYLSPNPISSEDIEPVEGAEIPPSVTYDFSATGRWAWLDTLHNIEAHLGKCVDAEDLKRLANIDGGITASWEFADVEEDCAVLYRATVETLFKDGEVVTRTVSDTDYEYTKENYLALGFDPEGWGSDEDEDEEEPEALECSSCGALNAPQKMYGLLCWQCANN